MSSTLSEIDVRAEGLDRIRRGLRSQFGPGQIIRLYTRLFPGQPVPESESPADQEARDIRLIGMIAERILAQRLSEGQVRDLAYGGTAEPQPGDIQSYPAVYTPSYINEEQMRRLLEENARNPPMMMPGPPPAMNYSLALTPQLGTALGAILNPKTLAQQFAAALLTGDMETAAILFDKLKDEGLSA